MNENKTEKIKSIVAKIDLNKIANYPEHPKSKTLRQIIRYSQRIIDSSNEQEIFRLTVRIAYGLEMIVNKTKPPRRPARIQPAGELFHIEA